MDKTPKNRNRNNETPLFQTTPMADDIARDPKTNVALPSEEATAQLKAWMESGKQ